MLLVNYHQSSYSLFVDITLFATESANAVEICFKGKFCIYFNCGNFIARVSPHSPAYLNLKSFDLHNTLVLT